MFELGSFAAAPGGETALFGAGSHREIDGRRVDGCGVDGRGVAEMHCGVRFCFTDRAGGHSVGTYASLNLSFDVGDEPATVTANRAHVLERLRLERAVWLRSEHGARVGRVDDAVVAVGPSDALVSDRAGIGLAALAADCALIVLADPVAGVIGVTHCGRAGLIAGVVAESVRALRGLGGQKIVAAIGPTICGSCYQLPPEMVDEVLAVVPAAGVSSGRFDGSAHGTDGHDVDGHGSATRGVDIRAGVVAQLAECDVQVRRLVGGCTREDSARFSYRRDHSTGRMAAIIWSVP